MKVKTVHHDTHGDAIEIYRGKEGVIFIDCLLDDSSVAFRGIYRAQDARAIAKRLNDLADIIEGKS